MCNYDELLYEANEKGLEIVEKYFKSDAKGLCKGNKIELEKIYPRMKKPAFWPRKSGIMKQL